MINLIEILKDYPKGRKLYSPLYGEVELDHVTDRTIYAKYLDCGNDLAKFNSEGQVWGYETGECMLFPSSDKKSWNYWQSVVFEKGDIITRDGFINNTYLYDGFNIDGYYGFNTDNKHTWLDVENFRFATEEESQQFLKDMEEKGFKWNEETNQVEKIETPANNPKFNVDDWIVNKGRSIRKIIGIDTSLNDYLTMSCWLIKPANKRHSVKSILAFPAKYSSDEIGFYSQDELFSEYITTILQGVRGELNEEKERPSNF